MLSLRPQWRSLRDTSTALGMTNYKESACIRVYLWQIHCRKAQTLPRLAHDYSI